MIQSSLFPELERAVPAVATPRRPLRICVLGSGSQGNAVVVEAGGRRLLIDAGFSARETRRRLSRVGLELSDLHGIVLTHEHGDHVRGLERLCRKHPVPVYATAGTLGALELRPQVAALLRPCRSGVPFEAAGFVVELFSIPHDAREPVGVVVEDPAGGGRVGLVADLGCRSRLAWARLAGVHALILEANHDLDMLRNGPYPWPLKQRVAGRHGHLSNADAAQGLEELAHDGLAHVVLYHLSQVNNLPALAAAVVGEELARLRAKAKLTVSGQFEPTPWLTVG
ncbi:MAG TPA: MBL fold metallo-hydrolase [Thermoanaerobaculia bacterium]|nr:MBL fold metallo-hydrolase [Thermoanaerobaculia bacterium]